MLVQLTEVREEVAEAFDDRTEQQAGIVALGSDSKVASGMRQSGVDEQTAQGACS